MAALRLHETGYRAHDRLAPRVDLERPEDHARAVGGVGFITNSPLKLSRVPSSFVRNLMADRARNAVGGKLLEFGAVVLAERKMREDFALAPGCASRSAWPSACGTRRTRPGWRAACVGWSIVSRRTPACQYGSRAELAIIVERHDAPIETSSPLGVTRLL